MNQVTLLVLVISLLSLSKESYAKDFYVSPAGDDVNPGTKELPFKSLEHAKEQVREWKLSSWK